MIFRPVIPELSFIPNQYLSVTPSGFFQRKTVRAYSMTMYSVLPASRVLRMRLKNRRRDSKPH